ncbi:MAG: hypothetical protein A4E65_00231 [Syntrophorhabdus sp. PtaU1.Bin153]|nr:MAG: hypothetical protein A4E65_00231 [Syntrophorhabdus sp. PtaU1.Bin153]
MTGKSFPNICTIEDIKLHIQQTHRNPNIGATHQITLKDGPRAYHIATVFEILDPVEQRTHHYSLRVDKYSKKRDGWVEYPPHCVWIATEPEELPKLFRFLQTIVEGDAPEATGKYRIINEKRYQRFEEAVKVFEQADSSEKFRLMKALLQEIERTPYASSDLSAVLAESNGGLLQSISVSARMIKYRTSYNEFSSLVEHSCSDETMMQKILAANPWLFGSEYSELLDRRAWTRDNKLDFMLRRTIDDYLEIVEIKTPFSDPLMIYDKSHDSYHPSAKLSSVIGQVIRYIEEVERQRDHILAYDNFDTLKIRARIIIGRDGNPDQQRAFHNLNAHLHGVEVLTFDQLLRIGKRILSLFQTEMDAGDNSRLRNSIEEDAAL